VIPVLSVDLDSTVCLTTHRHHMINNAERFRTDWRAYGLACAGDGDGPGMPLLQAWVAMGGKFIATSRRDHAAYALTAKWFEERELQPLEINLLKGPHSSLQTHHGLWKRDSIRDYERRSGNRVALHIDDWHGVTQCLLKHGIPAMTVAGDESTESISLTKAHGPV
jgi:hypothetical protein